MLNIKDYEEDINKLYQERKTAKEIATILKFKYHQPVYNYFKKMGWERTGITGKRIYKVNENFFKVINTENKAYILGFICADGHVAKDRLIITLAKKDLDILEKIKKAVVSAHPIKIKIVDNPYKRTDNKKLTQAILMIGSKKLVKPLFKMGLTSDKTYKLDGNILKYVPKYLIRDFLRGYFDGDGNVFFEKKYKSGRKFNINICGNKEFLLASFQKYFPSTNKLYKDLYSKQCYVWKISSKDRVLKFLNYLYFNSNIFLRRKYKEYLKATWSCKTGLTAGNSHSRIH